MELKTHIWITIELILLLFFMTACIITVLGYAGQVQEQIKLPNSMFVSCPDYSGGCSCNVYGDNNYMIDECVRFMQGRALYNEVILP